MTRVLASRSWPLGEVVRRAAWTWDPVFEEVVKVAPLLVLAVVFPRVHRQLGWTDHLLVGAGLGMGFELMEAALRYGRVGSMVLPAGGDWLVGGSLSPVTVPSVGTSLTTWQPNPAGSGGLWLSSSHPNLHLVWTAVAALGVVWVVRRRGVARVLGVVPVAWAALAHAASNAEAMFADPAAAQFAGTAAAGAAMWVNDKVTGGLVVVLVVVVVVDRVCMARARRAVAGLLLPGEPWHGLVPVAVGVAAVRAVPWSAVAAWHVVLGRRGAGNAVAAGAPDEVGPAVEAVGRLAAAKDQGRWRTAGRRQLGVWWRAWCSWRTAVWLVAMVPALVFLVVGGFPDSKQVQSAMSGTVGTALVVVGLLAAVGLAASVVPGLVRALWRLRRAGGHELAVRLLSRVSTTTTCAAFTVVLLVGMARAGGPTEHLVRNFHILDALSSAEFILGLAILLLAFVMFPPAGAALVLVTGEVIITASGVALATGAAVGGTLMVHAMLNEASGDDGWWSNESGSRPAVEEEPPAGGNLTRIDNDRIRQWVHDNEFSTVEKFKEEFVPRREVSRFDCFRGEDGKIYLQRKGTSIRVFTGYDAP
ncbi:MAG: hypothetical protein FWE61_05715 [Micrococcales bacterium]|nr:hypothetical protein [Micrococcales bacterium]